MTPDVIGIWDGTLVVEDPLAVPSSKIFALRFTIEAQDAAEKFLLSTSWRVVSTIRGHVQSGGWARAGTVFFDSPVPATGFVDDAGRFTFTSYGFVPEDATVYAGALARPRVGFGVISGRAAQGAFDHGFDVTPVNVTFRMKKLVFDFSDTFKLNTTIHILSPF
jgi:hypothetical protein